MAIHDICRCQMCLIHDELEHSRLVAEAHPTPRNVGIYSWNVAVWKCLRQGDMFIVH